MTRTKRKILFCFLAIVFILAAPAVILYSYGYRFDWQEQKIVQTGAFYFQVLPKNAEISLEPIISRQISVPQKALEGIFGHNENEKLVERTDFLFGTAFIDNLLPKKYRIIIKKDGYQLWEKTLAAKEKKVMEIKNVILIPEDPELKVLTDNLNDFFVSPNEKKIIFYENNSQSWALKLFDVQKNIKSHLIEEKEISKWKSNFLDLEFSPDSKKILLKIGLKEYLRYYLLDTEKSLSSLLFLDWLDNDSQNISFGPKDSEKLFLIKKNNLYEVNINKKEFST